MKKREGIRGSYGGKRMPRNCTAGRREHQDRAKPVFYRTVSNAPSSKTFLSRHKSGHRPSHSPLPRLSSPTP